VTEVAKKGGNFGYKEGAGVSETGTGTESGLGCAGRGESHPNQGTFSVV